MKYIRNFVIGLNNDGPRRLRWWSGSVLLVLALLTAHAIAPHGLWGTQSPQQLAATSMLLVFLSALLCEYLDSSLGMGYGTTLTPILLLAGFAPLQIVPAILLSEAVTGLAAGLFHQRDGNVDFLRDARARRTALLLICLSALGAVAAVALAIRLPGNWLGLLISGVIVAMGILILVTMRRPLRFSSGGIVAIGGLAAFNKGVSGGGYGPLVTAGQVVSGLPAKHAVAITSVAESFTCIVGLGAYLAMGKSIDFSLAVPLLLGAILSVPLATLTVRRLPENAIRASVGALTLLLGILALLKVASA